MPDPGEVNELVAGLLGAIDVGGAADAADQRQNVLSLGDKALGKHADGQPAPSDDDQTGALLQLQALARAAEIPSLDNAAKALTGVTALLTGLFTGIGFTTGDFVRMIRDSAALGFIFLVMASLALLLGTFAFVVNAYRSRMNLWAERVAVYAGIFFAGVAFICAGWGISQGASAGATRPTIQASINTSSNGPPSLSVSVASAEVPRNEDLTTTVWGHEANGWTVLRHEVGGPSQDGSATATISVNNVAAFDQLSVEAYLASTDSPVAAEPPATCALSTNVTATGVTSAQIGIGANNTSDVAAPLPGPPDVDPPACDDLSVPVSSTTTTTSAH